MLGGREGKEEKEENKKKEVELDQTLPNWVSWGRVGGDKREEKRKRWKRRKRGWQARRWRTRG